MMNKNTCPECGESFLFDSTLKWHRERVHGVKHNNPLICPECGMLYGNPDLLAQHRKDSHGVGANQPSTSFPSAASPVPASESVIGDSFKFYFKRFLYLMAITLIGEIVLALIVFAVAWMITGDGLGTASDLNRFLSRYNLTVPMKTVSVLFVIAYGLISIVMSGALVHATGSGWLGKTPNIKAAYIFAFRNCWRTVAAALLTILIIAAFVAALWLLMMLVGAILGVFLGRSSAIEPISICLLILFSLAIFCFCLRYTFVLQAALIEGWEDGTPISRSSNLVSGHMWRVFGTLLLIAIIMVPFGISMNVAVQHISLAASTFIYTLVSPLAMIIQTRLYFDLRSQRGMSESYSLATDLKKTTGINAGTNVS